MPSAANCLPSLLKRSRSRRARGGGDPEGNARLRKAILDAKARQHAQRHDRSRDPRGTGEEEGVNYEEITYEGYGPGGVACMIQSMTDNRNRTVAEIRHIFSKNGGNLGEVDQWVGCLRRRVTS